MNSSYYQNQVNSLTGAMGPTDSAFWPQSNSLLITPWSLNSAPLMYNTNTGLYETASDMSACKYNLAFGSKNKKSKKTRKNNKSRKHMKRRWYVAMTSVRKCMDKNNLINCDTYI